MKKMLIALILIASVSGSVENAAVNASTDSTRLKPVSVELTVKSPGAGGSQFILKGLRTPASPDYACSMTQTVTDAFSDGTSVHFAVLGLNGVDQAKITVNGRVVGKLVVINDTYVDQSGNSIVGRIAVRQLR